MTNTLAAPQLETVLDRLFAEAAKDPDRAARRPAGRPGGQAAGQAAGRADATASPLERAEALADFYLPISADAGRLLYVPVRASRPDTVVEFGTSFGISTIYLAAAVADNGHGRVITTELSSKKAGAARSNLRQAGVDGPVTVLVGDARQTLADLPGPIGLVLLDGWKDLCLPVLRLLEPKLSPGALVAADDNDNAGMADYLRYVRDPDHGYVSVSFPVDDG